MKEKHVEVCPECGSDEVYYENFRPQSQKNNPYGCGDCGWEGSRSDMEVILIAE